MPSTREKQSKQVGEEILELLSKPTAKERSLVEKFKSQGGAQVMEFCPHGTRAECERQQPSPANIFIENEDEEEIPNAEETDPTPDNKSNTKTSNETATNKSGEPNVNASASSTVTSATLTTPSATAQSNSTLNRCNKLHFKKIIQLHTDETLGDCSFLNTCFHMDTCKYVHYEVDSQVTSGVGNTNTNKSNDNENTNRSVALPKLKVIDSSTALHPPQWIQCDLRYLDMTVLGKFAVCSSEIHIFVFVAF